MATETLYRLVMSHFWLGFVICMAGILICFIWMTARPTIEWARSIKRKNASLPLLFSAASPQMYAALKAAEQILCRTPNISTNNSGKFRNISTRSVLAEVRAAIAKAEGGEA